MSADTWTAADDAELDALTFELARSYWDHRDHCEACKPEPCPVLVAYREHRAGCWNCQNGVTYATETYGEPCWIRLHFIAHGDTCKRCNPCPHLRTAIAAVLDWREARILLSRAEALRAERDAFEAAA